MAIYFYSFNSYPTGNTGLEGIIDSYTQSSSGVITITTGATFSPNLTAPNNVAAGDVIKIFDNSDTSNFIYAIITSINATVNNDHEISISYDYNIYNDDLTNMDKFIIYAKAVFPNGQPTNKYITSTQNSSYSYRINARVETAVYSEQYIRYKINTYYDVVLDSTRRYFFEDFINIATASDIIMIDDCASPSGVAYKVYMPESNFQLLNNKFRKNVTFKIVA
tara:strand:- start:2227 stop:2892 length:666 start_codon:yes stop_codon:yes gene_type:complete